MPFYLYEIRDSDGNDCAVYDCIVEAADLDSAEAKIFAHFDVTSGLTSDGDRGYYREAECNAEDEGDLNESGGIDITIPEVYATEDEAVKACVYYHSRYSL